MQPPAGSTYQMIPIGEKAITSREAVACGHIRLRREVLDKIESKTLPKGDVLALAETAGIMAAKKTSELLPLCHPLPLEYVGVTCHMNYIDGAFGQIEVRAVVRTTGKTGVEMEALSAVNGALLCIYDLTKMFDHSMEMGGIYLAEKKGGKSGHWMHPKSQSASTSDVQPLLTDLTAKVLTISDRCAAGHSEDTAGRYLTRTLSAMGAAIQDHGLVADEIHAIQHCLTSWVQSQDAPDFIVTTGGTGISPRDLTPEAVRPLLSKELPGFGELLRERGGAKTPYAYLSRSLGGVMGHTVIVCLPGSEKAVNEGVQAIAPLLKHSCHIAQNGKH